MSKKHKSALKDTGTDTTESIVTDPLADEFEIGDPVIDLANGRNMVIVDRAADSVEEWHSRNDYDLLENTGNSRLRAGPGDPVFTCVYVASVDSQPSKSYDFPSSRLGRPEYEHACDGTVYDLVARDVLSRVFDSMLRYEGVGDDDIEAITAHIGDIDPDVVKEGYELAQVDQQFDGGDD